jgi:CheY-like chemotaxis protein
VVLDHHMPEMTGMEMAARLRTDPTFATLPIVLLTSMDVDPNRPDFKALKFNSWLTKPARESLLIDTLLRVLRRAPTSAMERAVSPSVDEIAPPASSGAEIVVFEDAGRNRVAQANALLQPSDETFSLELWMDSEGLAESVACIGAALSASEESEAGSGDAAHIDRQIERYAQTAGKPAGQGDRLDILVAEDNEVNQIVFSQILDEMDVVYRIVSNGALALEALASADPRLILMDVSMPVMNGHQATRAIRQREVGTGQRVPIVGVTAHALKGDREACIEAGMDDYLSKPISPEKLEAKVREWLSHGDGASSARQQ